MQICNRSQPRRSAQTVWEEFRRRQSAGDPSSGPATCTSLWLSSFRRAIEMIKEENQAPPTTAISCTGLYEFGPVSSKGFSRCRPTLSKGSPAPPQFSQLMSDLRGSTAQRTRAIGRSESLLRSGMYRVPLSSRGCRSSFWREQSSPSPCTWFGFR